MTSNLASEKITSIWDEGEIDKDKIKEMVLPLFNEHFGTAFMGRANLIPFTPLHTRTLRDIAIIKIDKICQRFERASGQMYKIDYSDTLIDWITHHCQCEKSGARISMPYLTERFSLSLPDI